MNYPFCKLTPSHPYKIGAVSGMDKVFTSENGNQMFVCSFTKKTGKLKKMFYNIKHPDLLNF